MGGTFVMCDQRPAVTRTGQYWMGALGRQPHSSSRKEEERQEVAQVKEVLTSAERHMEIENQFPLALRETAGLARRMKSNSFRNRLDQRTRALAVDLAKRVLQAVTQDTELLRTDASRVNDIRVFLRRVGVS